MGHWPLGSLFLKVPRSAVVVPCVCVLMGGGGRGHVPPRPQTAPHRKPSPAAHGGGTTGTLVSASAVGLTLWGMGHGPVPWAPDKTRWGMRGPTKATAPTPMSQPQVRTPDRRAVEALSVPRGTACQSAGWGVPPVPGGRGWSLGQSSPYEGGGDLEPKSPKVCVPKTAQINISVCKISCSPTMKSGSGEGGC